VICMQEFFTPIVLGNHYNLRDSIIKMGYPYHFFFQGRSLFWKCNF
jgi:hypothetical protein